LLRRYTIEYPKGVNFHDEEKKVLKGDIVNRVGGFR